MRAALLLLLAALLALVAWLLLSSPGPSPLAADSGNPGALHQPDVADAQPAPGSSGVILDSAINRDAANAAQGNGSWEEAQLAGAISGLVLDPGGNPLAEATVAFLRRAENGALMLGLDHTAAVDRLLTTDREGRYAVANLPAGGAWDLCAWHADFCFTVGASVTGIMDSAQELPPIQLGDGYVVKGIVTDEQRNPLGGVSLVFFMAGWQALDAEAPSDPLGRFFQTESDEDGRFQFTGMGDGSWTLRARRADRGDGWIQSVLLLPRQQAPELKVVLGPESRLSGLTRTTEGKALPGVQLSLQPKTPGRGPEFSCESDPNGHFSLSGIPEGEWILQARRAGFLPASPLELESVTRADLVFELQAIGGVRGKLVNSQGLAPAGATLELWSAFGGLPPYRPLKLVLPVTDPEGQFEFPLSDPGTYLLLVRADGCAPTWSPLFQAHPQPTQLGAINLSAAAAVTGRFVTAHDQSPIAGARISIRSPGWDPAQASSPFAAFLADATEVPPLTSRTAADGSFSLEGLPVIPCLLVFEHPGIVTHSLPLQPTPGARLDAGEIRAQAAASLTIRGLDEEGTPLSGGNVLLQRDETGFNQSSYMLDADGLARIQSLPSGDCWISVIEGGELFGRSSPRQHLWLAPGEHQELVIRLEAPH